MGTKKKTITVSSEVTMKEFMDEKLLGELKLENPSMQAVVNGKPVVLWMSNKTMRSLYEENLTKPLNKIIPSGTELAVTYFVPETEDESGEKKKKDKCMITVKFN